MSRMACGQLVVVCLVPYPMVCCVSREKRKVAANPSISEMQGSQSAWLRCSGEKSPWL